MTSRFFEMFDYNTANYKSCEAQYVYSENIAEFWNTLSSFIMVIIAIRMLFVQTGSMAKQLYSLMLLLGLSLVIYHATLSLGGEIAVNIISAILVAYFSCIAYVSYIIKYADHVNYRGYFMLVIFYAYIKLIILAELLDHHDYTVIFDLMLFFPNFWTNSSRNAIILFIISALCIFCDQILCEYEQSFNFKSLSNITVSFGLYFLIDRISKNNNLVTQ